MKKLFTLFFFFLSSFLFAQPANDECENLIDLGVLPFCAVDTFFSSVGATQSNIGNDNFPMDCNPGDDWNFTGRDVWFSFVASDTIEDYSVTITGIMDNLGGSPLTNPQVAVYRGECGFDELGLLEYYNIEAGFDNLVFYDGPNNSSPVIDDLGGGAFGNTNNGGVCYSVQASSGCLTVELTSDGTTQFEGFAGTWKCSASPCENNDPLTVDDNITEELLVDALTFRRCLCCRTRCICSHGRIEV